MAKRRDLFRIEPHSSFHKAFRIDGPLPLYVDNDDVPGDRVELLAEQLVGVLNHHWVDPKAFVCHNEDCARCFEARETAIGDSLGGYLCVACEQPISMETISL